MPKFNNDGSVEYTHDEFEKLAQTKICRNCGTFLPLWEWAKRKPHKAQDKKNGVGCAECKSLPSQEDLDGIRREFTPADWVPKRNSKAQSYEAIVEEAASMMGIPMSSVKADDKGNVSAIVICKCGQKNRVKVIGGGQSTAICGRCKEVL